MHNQVNWGSRRKSSRSQGANNCVEVAHGDRPVVGVWDTKHRDAGPIVVPAARWQAFVATMKD
ncbi:DUF397 domain-containing protein [Saccharothrix stipae]